jgi:hypothetical protein
MQEQDMLLLLEVEENIQKLNDILQMLTGLGYSEGILQKLDNVYEVIQNNSVSFYRNSDKDFFDLMNDRELTIEKKCEILFEKSCL